jgi:PPOX class probable F420-dependent enzyme
LSQTQIIRKERQEGAEKRLSKEAIELLEQPCFGHVATVNKDGSLHVTPVWIDHEGDKYIVFNSAYGRRKVRNLERDSRVGISILDPKNPYHYMSVRGRVVEINSDQADPHIDKLAKKYLGKDKYPWRSPGEKRAFVKIVPEWIYLQ